MVRHLWEVKPVKSSLHPFPTGTHSHTATGWPPAINETASFFSCARTFSRSINLALSCPFSRPFPMRHFYLFPHLLAAPLVAGSLFLAPASIAASNRGASQGSIFSISFLSLMVHYLH